MPGLFIFQRLLPPYRVPYFRLLYREVGSIIFASKAPSGSHLPSITDSVDFAVEELPRWQYLSKETAIVQNVFPVLSRLRGSVVVSEFAVLYGTMWLLLLFRRFLGYRLIFWTHGIENSSIYKPFVGVKGSLTRLLYSLSDGLIVYSEDRKDIIRKYVPKVPIRVAPNVSGAEERLVLFSMLSERGRDAIRLEMGLDCGVFHVVMVGRLIEDKRVDLLVETVDIIARRGSLGRFCFHVVGDGPLSSLVDELVQRYEGAVRRYGAVWDIRELSRVLYVCDVLFNPGTIGLSVVDAFCFGLPVVAAVRTDCGPWHGPEYSFLDGGKNSVLCDGSAEGFADAMIALNGDRSLCSVLGSGALASAQSSFTADSIVRAFRSWII